MAPLVKVKYLYICAVQLIDKNIDLAVSLLLRNELVAIPTETVYGLAGNAFNDVAVAKIFSVKNRPSFDPLIVHTSSWERLEVMVKDIPPQARFLAEAFMPGPLTLLLPKGDLIPDIVTAGSHFVAVRIPKHPLTLKLLERLPFPLAAPSANPFGYISPTTPEHVAQQLGDKIGYILDGGPCTVGVESTIIGFNASQTTIYRKGGIAVEAIEAITGPVEVKTHSTSNPKAPGMLQSHYAPKVPLFLGNIKAMLPNYSKHKVGVISFQKSYDNIPDNHQIILSKKGDFTEAARGLFAGMRHLDSMALDAILAELLPERDLGRAINDRLRRAAQVVDN